MTTGTGKPRNRGRATKPSTTPTAASAAGAPKGTSAVLIHRARGWKAARSRRRLETFSHLSGVMGSEVVKHLGVSSGPGLEIVRRSVEAGIPSTAVRELQRELRDLRVPRPSKYVEVIASRATRARRKTLTPEEGERLVRVAGVVARALDVWEVESDAADFLTTPHPMLSGETPMDRARSELGARQVEDLLTKLDLGLPV